MTYSEHELEFTFAKNGVRVKVRVRVKNRVSKFFKSLTSGSHGGISGGIEETSRENVLHPQCHRSS